MAIHTGSWGLPDLGITEAIGGLLGVQSNQQGGSNLSGTSVYSPVPANQTSSSVKGAGGTVSFPSQQSVAGAATSAPKASSASATGGSSGGSSGGFQPGQNGYVAPVNTDMTEINRQIDDAYNPTMGYLSQAEGNLRNDFPTILSDINSQYGLGVDQATNAKGNALGAISSQQEMATQKNNDVMADARRLYDELRRGYGQRFGGASSAGQAATELGNLEQQRQQGKIGRDYTNTINQIEGQRVQVQQKYDESLKQLEVTKNTAVNEANRDFQNKLLQISQSRAETEQAKAQARLGALQDLRNKVFQINLQNMQFQQSLQAQKASADQYLSQYTAQLGQSVDQSANAVGSFNPSVSSSLQAGGGNMASSGSPYVGAISTARKPEDQASQYGLASALA
jgi:hypothetical protein